MRVPAVLLVLVLVLVPDLLHVPVLDLCSLHRCRKNILLAEVRMPTCSPQKKESGDIDLRNWDRSSDSLILHRPFVI